MKKIKLTVGKSWESPPLVDEGEDYIYPSNLEELNNELINALWLWQHDYDESASYNSWSMYSKISFERQGLLLAQCLSVALPKNIQFTYYSELYHQEIEF